MRAFRRLIDHALRAGRKLGAVEAESAAERRVFDLYAVGDDRFLIQRGGRAAAKERRRSLVLARRADLRAGRRGMLCALSTGHFGTVLTPLFSGALGDLCRVPRGRRSETLARRVALANVASRAVELLQRETDFALLAEADRWLQAHGFGLDEVAFCERTPEALAYAEPLGQVWRIRPRVYTVDEMRRQVAHAWLRVETPAHYLVSLRGVHWLLPTEFARIAALAAEDPAGVLACLREWAALAPGERQSALRRAKGNAGRHALEFFGVPRAAAQQLLVPALERILEGVTLGRMDARDVADTLAGLALLFRRLLRDPAFADPSADRTVLALYACLNDDGPADAPLDFDARRVALPGVTFRDGAPLPHPGADARTLAAVRHVGRRLSHNETLEWINVYDVRSSKSLASGAAQTREVVFKTDRTPVPVSLIQKRLGSARPGYADYLLVRANLFRALGADYPILQLLSPPEGAADRFPYFLRSRSPGDPLDAIDPALFRCNPQNPHSPEEPAVVLALATLYGSAAAQNLAAKKYLPGPPPTSRFGIGKEIFQFVYDPFLHRQMPTHVQVCSIRGTLGWPNPAQDEANLRDAHRFYLRAYALALGDYWGAHKEACTLNECASAFFDGFARKTEAMHWAYLRDRRDFDAFAPRLPRRYAFRLKRDFALWALSRAAETLPALREHFMDAVRDVFVKAQ